MQLNLWQKHWDYHFRIYFECEFSKKKSFQISHSNLSNINATKTKNISFRWIWCAKNFNEQYFLQYVFDFTHFCSVEKRLMIFIIWFILIFIIIDDAEHLNCKILRFFWNSFWSFFLKIEFFHWWNHVIKQLNSVKLSNSWLISSFHNFTIS